MGKVFTKGLLPGYPAVVVVGSTDFFGKDNAKNRKLLLSLSRTYSTKGRQILFVTNISEEGSIIPNYITHASVGMVLSAADSSRSLNNALGPLSVC